MSRTLGLITRLVRLLARTTSWIWKTGLAYMWTEGSSYTGCTGNCKSPLYMSDITGNER
jgi:hypothetical protein